MTERREYPGRGRRARRRFLRHPAGLTACILIACVSAGCNRDAEPAEPAPASREIERGYVIERLPPEELSLEDAASSLDDLLRTVERSLADSDTSRLLDLMIGEREYRDILYPAFPAAHPPINASFETLWVLQYPDSFRGMHRLLALYGGRDVHILNVRFDEPDQDFVNFVLHEGSRVDFTVDGERIHDMRLFGSVVEIGDQWKVLTYPDHPDDSF